MRVMDCRFIPCLNYLWSVQFPCHPLLPLVRSHLPAWAPLVKYSCFRAELGKQRCRFSFESASEFAAEIRLARRDQDYPFYSTGQSLLLRAHGPFFPLNFESRVREGAHLGEISILPFLLALLARDGLRQITPALPSQTEGLYCLFTFASWTFAIVLEQNFIIFHIEGIILVCTYLTFLPLLQPYSKKLNYSHS